MTQSNRVLIVNDMHESILPLLKDAGFEPDYQPRISRSEILESLHNYVGMIIRSRTNVDKELIDTGHNLKFIARAGAGMDKVDEAYLIEKGIEAINAPEGNRDSLGEHTLGLLLGLLHKINAADREVRKGQWNRKANRGIELKGKTVGIYGYGYMGEAFAQKLSGLDCTIIAYDKYRNGFGNDHVKEVTLNQLEREAEILSLHVPLNEETRAIFNYELLSRYQNLKVLINTARGEILSTEAVTRLLEEKKLLAAGLDVLHNEKPGSYNREEEELFERLISSPNVILTPHVAGWTYESYERINQVIVEKIKNSELP